MNASVPHIAIIGAGPAGLMAAEVLGAAGLAVTLYERMPSPARKFLMAGRGGLNLTHSEDFDRFVGRYGEASDWLQPILAAFPPQALRDWCEALGEPTFVGSSGRVFPKSFKASPLLRAWLRRLQSYGVSLKTRHAWRGWDVEGALVFSTPEGEVHVRSAATVLALGGASWPRLGSDGGWRDILGAKGIPVQPFAPANCGFDVAWSPHFRQRFAGTPLKPVEARFGSETSRGEIMLSDYGVEGGAIYALSRSLRQAIAARGEAVLTLDLKPGVSAAELGARLVRRRLGESMANRLRKVGLSAAAAGLLREGLEEGDLAARIKAVPLLLTGTRPLERAISSAGGIERSAVDGHLMLKDLPGVFVAGEMLDWEAPTGGYLLQASFATGVAAAKGVLHALGRRAPSATGSTTP
ncbi:TIGR03862 family flavoprotein [Methylovirgula sp. 4M-Z18]|uniref:TIGR03862 family flavoprotein n=1 Tax=Methylovirgula sp. 4M-Z18 TaxID=2293567 RepID=UPI000E2FA1A6|nr:TIGR03862 family flavoprotein [Methylovirgula sp. 4M-Z18]RFB79709.1 TIGR03862 family flavoprotein [Methylovirgula sp. 4M-Z18]